MPGDEPPGGDVATPADGDTAGPPADAAGPSVGDTAGPPAAAAGAGDTGSLPATAGSAGAVVPRDARRRPPRRGPGRLLTWAVVGLVLVIVVVLVVVKLVGSSTPDDTAPKAQPVPASVLQQISSIPASVYDTVGTTSPTVTVTPPKVVAGAGGALTAGGKPVFMYVGAEFNSFSAAQRWAIVAALSRFGQFDQLQTMQSSSGDVFGNTQSFTFAGSTYRSPYLSAQLREVYGNQQNSSGTGWAPLQSLTAQQSAVVGRYDTARYTGLASAAGPTIPFVDVGNRVVAAGAGYSPSILQGLTASQIAAGLTDPNYVVTQAIVATANYLSAAICSVDGNQPSKVCGSLAVDQAARALGLPAAKG